MGICLRKKKKNFQADATHAVKHVSLLMVDLDSYSQSRTPDVEKSVQDFV
jgi:hypothetical protein